MIDETAHKKELPSITCLKAYIQVTNVDAPYCMFCGNKQSCKAMLDKLNKEQDETNKTISGTDTTKGFI